MGLAKTVLIGAGIVIISVLIFFSSSITGFVASNLNKTEFSLWNIGILIVSLIVVFYLVKKY